MNMGIYVIEGPEGKSYVGSTEDLQRRWWKHRSALRNGKHGNPALQAAWDRHGESAFQFRLIQEIGDPAELVPAELATLGSLGSDRVYNSEMPDETGTRFTRSPETRRKMSEAKKGNKNWLGKTHSPEARRKMSEARKAWHARRKQSPVFIQLSDLHFPAA